MLWAQAKGFYAHISNIKLKLSNWWGRLYFTGPMHSSTTELYKNKKKFRNIHLQGILTKPQT